MLISRNFKKNMVIALTGVIVYFHQACAPLQSALDGDSEELSSLDLNSYTTSPLSTGLRRLSINEANQSLFKIFGDTGGLATKYLPEGDFSPFDNDYRMQPMTEDFVRGAEFLAIDVAKRFIADATRFSKILACTTKDDTCVLNFIKRIGQQTFRRPLSSQETTAISTAAKSFSVFNDKIELIVRVFLQSPNFWTLSEVGTPVPNWNGVRQLSSLEIASRMSYFILGMPPDDQLLKLAVEGKISQPEILRNEAERLLQTPAALAQADRLHALWLGYDSMKLSVDLITSMRQETKDLLEKILFTENKPWVDLLRSNTTHIDDTLAAHYGLPLSGKTGKNWVNYGNSGRQGILSHGTFLSAAAKFGGTSPTQRGYHIRKNLFCQPIPPPPPNVSADDPPPETANAKCKVARYKANQMVPGSSCYGCHIHMDPVGFGLENFTESGKYITSEINNPECIIDGQGELNGFGKFSGPKQLSELIIQTNSVESCLVTRVVEFAFGRRLDSKTTSDVMYKDNMVRTFKGHGNYKKLILDIVSSAEFSLRREEQ